MKFYQPIFVLTLTIFLAACGLNPAQNFQESMAEQIIEDSTGSNDANIDIEEDSISFSMEDEDGNTTGVSTSVEENLEEVEAFGFVIAIPEGLTNGTVQKINSGPTNQVIVSLEVEDATAEQFFEQLHTELALHNFTFDDIFNTGVEQPDPSADGFIPNVNYKHPDGHTALVVWANEKVVMTFSK